MALKFKINQKVKFIGNQEKNYHPDYLDIMGKQGVIVSADDYDIKWKYEIAIDGMSYPVSEAEIEGV